MSTQALQRGLKEINMEKRKVAFHADSAILFGDLGLIIGFVHSNNKLLRIMVPWAG